MLLLILLRKTSRRRTIGFAALILFVATVSNGCGVTADNAPAPVVGTTVGVYPLVITATGTGNVTATTTLSLSVN
jgi:hypothetical protein